VFPLEGMPTPKAIRAATADRFDMARCYWKPLTDANREERIEEKGPFMLVLIFWPMAGQCRHMHDSALALLALGRTSKPSSADSHDGDPDTRWAGVFDGDQAA